MAGTLNFDHGKVYQRVPKGYAEWCDDELDNQEEDGTWRSGKQIAEALDEIILNKE